MEIFRKIQNYNYSTQARVQRVRQAFGQYANKCEGVNNRGKTRKILKPKNGPTEYLTNV
jgi:hypothetical protein